jgi:hypothetical protein
MTSFASVDRLLDDAWIAIASFLTHDELRRLSLTSHHIGAIAVSNAVREWLPLRDFSRRPRGRAAASVLDSRRRSSPRNASTPVHALLLSPPPNGAAEPRPTRTCTRNRRNRRPSCSGARPTALHRNATRTAGADRGHSCNARRTLIGFTRPSRRRARLRTFARS